MWLRRASRGRVAESLREAEMIAMIVLVKNHNYDVIRAQVTLASSDFVVNRDLKLDFEVAILVRCYANTNLFRDKSAR